MKKSRYLIIKSSLYFIYGFIYGLLFSMIANTTENRLVIGLTITCAALFVIASLILSYIEDKYN